LAKLNGKDVSLEGLTMRRVCEIILDASPTGDGRGIKLVLTADEMAAFDKAANGEEASGFDGSRVLQDLLIGLLKERLGRVPAGLHFSWTLSTGVFVIK